MAVLDGRHLSGEAWRAIVEPAGFVVVAHAIRDGDGAIAGFEVRSRNDAARQLDLVVGGPVTAAGHDGAGGDHPVHRQHEAQAIGGGFRQAGDPSDQRQVPPFP